MDVTPALEEKHQQIESYGPGQLIISGATYTSPVIVFPETTIAWSASSVSELTIEHFAPLVEQSSNVEILLLGCGNMQEFVAPSLRRELRTQHHITLDSMDTGAACRTFNILLAEGRRVAAALFLIT
jgi:uncharacterized protein